MRWTPEGRARALAAALYVAPACAFVALGVHRRWICDDGFINFRVVGMLLDGQGLVYNAGERVEAFTSPLWIALLAVGGALGLKLGLVAVVLGLAFGAGGIVAAVLSARRLWLGDVPLDAALREHRLLPLGAVAFVALPPVWDFATSGLELGLALGWAGASMLATTRAVAPDATARRGYASAVLVSLGPLVRPELALLSVGLLALIAVRAKSRRGHWRDTLGLVACAAALPLAYEVFRMGYYASLLPNTALAKEAFADGFAQGRWYFRDVYGRYLLSVPLGALLLPWFFGVRERWLERRFLELGLAAVPVVAGLLHGAFVVLSGGDFMHARLLLLPLFTVLLPVAAVPLSAATRAGRIAMAVAAGVVGVWAVGVAGWARPPLENVHGIGDERGWYTRIAGVQHPLTLDDYERTGFHDHGRRLAQLAACDHGECAAFVLVDIREGGDVVPPRRLWPLRPGAAAPGIRLVALRGAIGIIGGVAGPAVHVVDHHGLAEPLGARLTLNERERPGHDKRLSNYWMLARFASKQEPEDARVAAARQALSCPDPTALMAAVTESLTLSRFWQNLLLAPRLTTLRIPTDPLEAERKLCAELR